MLHLFDTQLYILVDSYENESILIHNKFFLKFSLMFDEKTQVKR